MIAAEKRTETSEKRAKAAEKRAEEAEKKVQEARDSMQEKIDRLLSLVVQLRNGEEQRAMTARAEKAEKMVADLITSDRTLRGTKGQRRRNDDDGNDDASCDAQSEKDNMGGKDTANALP